MALRLAISSERKLGTGLDSVNMKTRTKIFIVAALALTAVAATIPITTLPPRTTIDAVDVFPFTHVLNLTTYRITASNFIWNAMGFWATNDLARTNWVQQRIFAGATNQLRFNAGTDVTLATNAVGPLLFYTINAGSGVLTNAHAYSSGTPTNPALSIIGRSGLTNDLFHVIKANGDTSLEIGSNGLVRIMPYDTAIADSTVALLVDGSVRVSSNLVVQGNSTTTKTNAAANVITTNNTYYGLQAVTANTYQPDQMPVLLTNIVDLSQGWMRIQYTNTGDIYMPHTTNRPAADDQVRPSTWIVNTGITNRNFTFNAAWTWLGTNAPGLVASNKVLVFNFTAWGNYESNVIATWSVQP